MKTSLRKVWLVAVSVLFMLCISLFVACGAKTYTLTFVTDGGTEIAPITAEAGAEITPPADPEKSGFSFDGWFLSSDFSGDKVTVPSVMPEKDVTYYAKFTENAPEATATLTLDAGIGNLDTTTYQLVIGTNVSQFLKDIVPTVEEGIIFAGWFRGESEVGSSVILPAGGMELTAKYKAKYTIKAYLQGLDGEYVLDENFAEKEGMDWLGSTISADSVPWDAPQFYRVNEELTQSLTLLDGKGVFEIYYDRNTYSVYYLDGAPDGTTVTGTTESQTGIINGNTVIVKENGYSLEGYRFAGWATSLNGPVEYQAGDSIEINGRHVTLYARWNYGATDANGGTDIIYVLAEKAGTVVLERQYREDETGTYEADTRVFTFATDDGQKTLYGRISADGKTFAYFREDVKLTYYWYDWQTSATEPSETVTLELDGIDGAVYTTKDGREISGTYTPDDGVYKFTADSEDLEFYFALGIASVSDKEDTDVFLIRDEFAGSYDYMNASGNIYQTPTLVIDGFGKAIYTVSEEAMEAVYTILPDGYLEVVYNDNGVEKTVVCNIVGLVDTTAGTQRAVFEISDAARGEYTFEIGEAKEEITVTLDGFGKASWYQADSEGKEYTLLAEGTYIGSEEEGYTVTFATAGYEDKGFSFIVTTRTASGYVYPVYILADSELTVEYTIIGGGSVVVDAYGRVTYTDAEGNTYNAILQISEDTVIEGRQKLLLIVYNEDNTGIEAVYIYVIENGTELRPTDGKSGNYALLEGDQIFPDTYIVLDGFGGAVLTVGGKEVAKGTYEPTDGTNEFIFCSETEGTADFTFYLTSVLTVDGTTYSVYIVYEEKWDAQFNSSDWQVILLDGYNSATLIDFNGYAYEVNYELLGESVLHLFGSSMDGRYFNADAETKTFTQITEEFVIENGVLLAYQGAGGKIKIPDEVTEIGPSVFYLAPITSVDLNNVTTIDEYAFQAVMLTEITGTDNVTSIGDYAFYQNIVLASVNFPKIETVGEYAFARSEGLENVSLGASLKSIGKNAFFYCGTYNNAVFTLTLEGTSAPTMGEDVFLNCGKKGCYVAVKDLDTVIAYRGDAKWADYAKYVGIAVKAENGAGNYYTSPASETAASLTLGVQVIFNGESIGVYELEGNKLSVYLFDGETGVSDTPVAGTLTDGVIEINLKETQYKLYIEGSEWTFKNEENTLTIMAGTGTVQGFYNETPISVTLGEEISFILDNRKHIITDLNETELTFTEELADSYELKYTNVNSDDRESVFTLEIKGEGTENIGLVAGREANCIHEIDGRTSSSTVAYFLKTVWTIDSIKENVYTVAITYNVVNYGNIVYYVAFIVDNETMTFDYYLVKTVHPEVVADNGAKVELTVFYDIPESVNDTISGTGEIIGLSAIINGEQVTIDSVAETSDGYIMIISEGEYAGTYTVEIKLSTSIGRKITSIKYAA